MKVEIRMYLVNRKKNATLISISFIFNILTAN